MSEIEIGDIVVPKGCLPEYQAENKITVQHIKKMKFETVCDGEKAFGEYLSASENGWSWYPLSTLEKWEESDGLL